MFCLESTYANLYMYIVYVVINIKLISVLSFLLTDLIRWLVLLAGLNVPPASPFKSGHNQLK